MGISSLYINVCTIPKDIGVSKERELWLPNKEPVSGQRCERTTMASKCEIFINCSKNFIGIFKTNMNAKQGIIKAS